MADNEEKYFIHKVWGETIIRGNKFTTFHNDYGVEFTRQEAIRKMCDAYFKAKDKGVTESERVQAALNALLEGGK